MRFAIHPSSYFLNWHTVFLWLPVEVADGEVWWLRSVERKFSWRGSSGQYYDPKYRKIRDNKEPET